MEGSSAVGAVLVADDLETLAAWWDRALDEQDPPAHGPGYAQRLVGVEASGHAVGFYLVEGYPTAGEDLAFAHAFFVLDAFLDLLGELRPARAFAFVDVGADGIEADERVGCRDVVGTVSRRLGLSWDELAALRATALASRRALWRA